MHNLREFCESLAAKQSTPGGGAAAAVVGAVGAAAGEMACVYTCRKKDRESGAAAAAGELAASLAETRAAHLASADADAKAYAALQRTWKKGAVFQAGEVAAIKAEALAVPVAVVDNATAAAADIGAFLPSCNPNIASDAKVGIHLLAGAARAAYATVLVNDPSQKLRDRLEAALAATAALEARVLPPAASPRPSLLAWPQRADRRALAVAAAALVAAFAAGRASK